MTSWGWPLMLLRGECRLDFSLYLLRLLIWKALGWWWRSKSLWLRWRSKVLWRVVRLLPLVACQLAKRVLE